MSTTKFHIELSAGQTLTIGGTVVTLEHKSGQRARLLVQAPADIKIISPGRNPNHNPGAHECASSPVQAKEHTNGKHPL